MSKGERSISRFTVALINDLKKPERMLLKSAGNQKLRNVIKMLNHK